MVDADKEKVHHYEALFFGIEDVREGYTEKAKARNIPWYFIKKKPGPDFKSYTQIKNIIRQSQPDILFISSVGYMFPAR